MSAQYAIWYEGMVIEHTGYFPTLEKAKEFARKRYGSNKDIEIQAVYPKLDPVKHPVNTPRKNHV